MKEQKAYKAKYPVSDDRYRIRISDHILDNIYGHIGLTSVESKIERLPIFKRLHNISQLGLVNWIFPCALHTRYIHSIGVMHIVGEMASHINTNMGEDFFNDDEIQILRLTGLLHDIGHYPLSHNIEFAYKDANYVTEYKEETVSENLKHFVNCPDYLNPDYISVRKIEDPEEQKNKRLSEEEKFHERMDGSAEFHHENMGRLIITHNEDIRRIIRDEFVLVKNGPQVNVNSFFVSPEKRDKELTSDEIDRIVKDLLQAIGNLVVGNYGFEPRKDQPWLAKYSAMIQLIHSELDADNLDYLLRDATFSGASYGTMDMSVLLNCLYVKTFRHVMKPTDKPSSENGIDIDGTEEPFRYVVGVTKKGIGAVDQFLIGKFMAYSQMIMSKHVSILEAMLYRIESEMLIKDGSYTTSKLKKIVTAVETETEYLAFTDSHIMQAIFSQAPGIEGYRILPKAIIKNLINSIPFELADAPDNECVCVVKNEENIENDFKSNRLYRTFQNFYETIKDKRGEELTASEEAELFSYRFEQYPMTKQISIHEFQDRFLFSDMMEERRFAFHYYRLGNGIPVLDHEQDYTYEEEEPGIPNLDKIPILCVDCNISALKELQHMQYISLRKYNIAQ